MTSFAPDSIVLNRKLPLWYQVSQSLRASILGRSPRDPLRLPTEEQLAGHYGVSVLTMRQALKELEDEGLISATAGGARSSSRRPAGCPGPPARLGRRDRGPAVGDRRPSCWTTARRRCRRELAEYFPEIDEVGTYHRLRGDEKTRRADQPRPQLRPARAGRPHRPGRPAALADDQGAA